MSGSRTPPGDRCDVASTPPVPDWAITLWAEVRAHDRRLDRVEALVSDQPLARGADDPVARLREQCRRAGIPVTIDDHVDEPNAAVLLGWARSTLKSRRNSCSLPEPLQRYRRNLRKIEYALAAIADYLAEHEDNLL